MAITFNSDTSEVMKMPSVFFYSLFKPKAFALKLITENKKISISTFLILCIVIVISNSLSSLSFLHSMSQYLSVCKAKYGIFYNFLFLYQNPLISSFGSISYMFIYSYTLQNSFRNNEFKKLKDINKDKWYREKGFFQVVVATSLWLFNSYLVGIFFYVPGIHSWIQKELLTSQPSILALMISSLIGIFGIYSTYAGFLTLRTVFWKEDLIDCIFWLIWNGVLASMIYYLSFLGILLIPFLFFKRNELKDFYDSV